MVDLQGREGAEEPVAASCRRSGSWFSLGRGAPEPLRQLAAQTPRSQRLPAAPCQLRQDRPDQRDPRETV